MCTEYMGGGRLAHTSCFPPCNAMQRDADGPSFRPASSSQPVSWPPAWRRPTTGVAAGGRRPSRRRPELAPAPRARPRPPSPSPSLSNWLANNNENTRAGNNLLDAAPCRLCLLAYPQTVLVPCGHCVLCDACTRDLLASHLPCPVCHSHIAAAVWPVS